MSNLNYNIAKTEALINDILSNLPVGVAYLILHNKTQELEKLYYIQAQKEMDAATASNASSEETPPSEDVDKRED